MTPASGDDRARNRAAMTAIAMLGASNVVTNRHLGAVGYVPWNLALTGGLVRLARSAGCSLSELGLDQRRLPRALRLGVAGACAVGGVYGVLLRTRPRSGVLRDERASSVGAGAARWHVWVRIPFGTVLAEEVAFRGVLPALLSSPRRASWFPPAAASTLFGLWHVLPARDLLCANAGVGRFAGARGAWLARVLAVAVTTLAGGVLHALRQRGGHLAAPVTVHLAANVLGFLSARAAGALR